MCELLGLSFNDAVNPKISFKGFQKRGKNNPDGWGIAYYENQQALIKKEPKNALSSDFLNNENNLENINSKIIIGHVRKMSQGKPSYNNTHRTDSERIFCHLLNFIREKGIKNWKIGNIQCLEKEIREINKEGTLNCLFTDGEYLFCYHDRNDYIGLYFIQRKPPYDEIKLEDIDWKVDLREEKNPNKTGYIIATKQLTNESWERFNKGELIVFEDGEMIYSSHREV
jgi:glutamine amidotransferase